MTTFLVNFIIRYPIIHDMGLEGAIESLRRGEFILLHDSAGRENEVDMVVAAEFAGPEHVARMRQHAGGLLCLAIDSYFGKSLGVRYMHEILAETDSVSEEMIMGLAPYGDSSTFSITINHHQTYTGITDRDRSLTIRELADLYDMKDPKSSFVSSFKTPGHVPLLVASDGLLSERRGHTEMSVYLTKLAGLAPAAAICEMMDATTYAALSVEKAHKYAKQNAIPLVDGGELVEYARVH